MLRLQTFFICQKATGWWGEDLSNIFSPPTTWSEVWEIKKRKIHLRIFTHHLTLHYKEMNNTIFLVFLLIMKQRLYTWLVNSDIKQPKPFQIFFRKRRNWTDDVFCNSHLYIVISNVTNCYFSDGITFIIAHIWKNWNTANESQKWSLITWIFNNHQWLLNIFNYPVNSIGYQVVHNFDYIAILGRISRCT